MIKIKKNPSSFLNFRGYVLLKKDHSEDELNELRKELMVKPHVPSDYGQQVKPFPVYMESKEKFYLPEAY